MLAGEEVGGRVDRLAPELAVGHVGLDLVELADIAHVGRALERGGLGIDAVHAE